MWKISESLKDLIIPQLDGFEFIYKSSIYIPIKQIGINALVRQETTLPLTEEIILRLMDLKHTNIKTIAKLIGIDEGILNEILGDMSLKRLIYPKGEKITITPVGQKALKNLTRIKIANEVIPLQLNGISGEFMDLSSIRYNVPRFAPCLDSDIIVDKEYLEKQSVNIDQYYNAMQDEMYLEYNHLASKSQIYQLMDLECEKTGYIEKDLLIYRNLVDNDLSYVFQNEQDNVYSTAVSKQIQQSTGIRAMLKNRSEIVRYGNAFEVNEEFKDNLGKLITAIINDKSEEMEQLYFKDRLMLHKEYLQLLQQIRDIKPQKILISSSCIDVVCNSAVLPLLYSFCTKRPTCIAYNSDDYASKRYIKSFDNTKKIKIIEDKNINRTTIVLYPYCLIEVEYKPQPVSDLYVLQEQAKISFDRKMVKEKTQLIENLYDLKLDKNNHYI